MTDELREKVRALLEEFAGGVPMSEYKRAKVGEVTNAIMELIGGGVVTDEMVEAFRKALLDHPKVDVMAGKYSPDDKEPSEYIECWDGSDLHEALTVALTAALPHARTVKQVENDLLERLAVEAGDMMVAEIDLTPGANGGACLDLADWLRDHKKGATD